MCTVYGYVRVSTKQQRLQRKIVNIKDFAPDAVIFAEKQSGKDIEGRAVLRKLLQKVKSGDTIVFDEVSRMSCNASEGFEMNMELMQKGVNLVFLKQRHIDTAEYQRRSQRHYERVQTNTQKYDNFVNGVIKLLEELAIEDLKDNIKIAFAQAEHERQFLIKRVTHSFM